MIFRDWLWHTVHWNKFSPVTAVSPPPPSFLYKWSQRFWSPCDSSALERRWARLPSYDRRQLAKHHLLPVRGFSLRWRRQASNTSIPLRVTHFPIRHSVPELSDITVFLSFQTGTKPDTEFGAFSPNSKVYRFFTYGKSDKTNHPRATVVVFRRKYALLESKL
jgi:hypothetical protein